jgi:hypothetical protein
MVTLKPNRKKLPARRMVIYLLIMLFLILTLCFWNRLVKQGTF